MAIDRTTKLRWRRKVKQRQRQIEGIGLSTEEHIDRHFFRRLGRLYEVRRFLTAWILLLIALIGGVVVQTRALGDYYLKLVPAEGGIFSEGIIGSYTNANPIFAASDVDMSASKLLFSGLLTYDANNKLTGDLADSWTVDDTGRIYSVGLRRDIKWHDGTPFTAEDVAFTIRMVQNPDTRSPYFASWQGIKAEAADPHTVVFTLPGVLASFPYSLTMGMLPRHKLQSISPVDLRGLLFNTVEPVGTGPFVFGGVEVRGDTAEEREQRISLVANKDYHRGRPKLDEFILRIFLSENTLIESFNEGRLNAVSGSLALPLTGQDVSETSVPLTGSVMSFFNTTSPLLKDAKVRRALTMATNRPEIVSSLSHKGVSVDGPLLPEHIGYNPKIVEYGYDPAAANTLLNQAGWRVDDAAGGIRTKNGQKLTLSLNTLSNAEYASVANKLQKQWHSLGVELIVSSLAQNDLQMAMDERSYDVLLYGIVMGLDSDQFAYWHSSQADVLSQRRLNFSNYKSAEADGALEAGRTRVDPALRAAKYTPFLKLWREDAPAVALYRPRFLYTVYGKLYNYRPASMNNPVDRYNNVNEWMIRTDRAIL